MRKKIIGLYLILFALASCYQAPRKDTCLYRDPSTGVVGCGR